MRSLESLGGADSSANSAENAETLKSVNEARGEKTNEVIKAEHEALLKERANILAALREKGIDLEDADSSEDQSVVSEDQPADAEDRSQDSASEHPDDAEFIDDFVLEPSPAELGNKIKTVPKFAKYITGIVAGVAALVAVAGVAAHGINSTKAAPEVITNAPIVIEETAPVTTPVQPATEITFDKSETVQGIVDGYDKENMWLSEGKSGQYAFADFEKVVESHDGDVKEAIKEVAKNQVETMADFISGLSNKLRPAGYENLSMTEIDDKIENLSDVDYHLLRIQFENLVDRASAKETTLNGKYDNAYMGVKDGDKIYGSKDAAKKGLTVDHEHMQLMKCTTNEKGSKAYELSWTDADGKVIGTITIKALCEQIVEKEGSNPIRFINLPEATEQTISGGGSLNIITGGGGKITVIPTPDPSPPKPPKPPTPPKPPKPVDPEWGNLAIQILVQIMGKLLSLILPYQMSAISIKVIKATLTTVVLRQVILVNGMV